MSIEFIAGTQTKIELISQSHGAVRVPLAQNFDYTPSFEERRIFEFDSADAVAVVTNFNGVEVRFDHFDTHNQLVDAVVNDLDPAATALADDPSLYKEVTIMLNIRSKDTNLIFQSVLAKAVRLTGAASAEPVRTESTISRSGVAINVLRLKGVALEYSRALRSGSTAFPQGSANSNVDKVAALNLTNYEITLINTPQVVVANDPAINGTALIHVLKNGNKYTGATISASKILIPSADFGANDVFEAWTTYLDV